MKFIYRIIIGLSCLMFIFMTLWGIFFFRSMEAEINDETDDMLEAYSADIIMKWLSGVEIPSIDNGSNNTYYIRKVSPDYARSVPSIRYENTMTFIAYKDETEAARVRRQIFMDRDDTYYELTVAVPTFERQDLTGSIFKWMVFLFFILLVGGICITVAVVYYNFRPLKALLRWVDGYVPGKKNPPVPCRTGIIEFRTLAQATQRAADRFEKQYEIQNQFIGNASHELQTPLAVCTGRIEMLLDSDTLTQSQAEELVKINRTLHDMTRLNRTLLMMTKIDNGQFIDTSDIDLGQALRDAVAMYDEIYEMKNVHSELSVAGNPVVKMNEQLANILISNLLKNAFMHSPEGTVVDVCLGNSELRISNYGDSPLDKDRVFDRFYQGSAKKEGSTGLGLALVKAVCDRYSFRIGYEYSGRHNFIVRF